MYSNIRLLYVRLILSVSLGSFLLRFLEFDSSPSSTETPVYLSEDPIWEQLLSIEVSEYCDDEPPESALTVLNGTVDGFANESWP